MRRCAQPGIHGEPGQAAVLHGASSSLKSSSNSALWSSSCEPAQRSYCNADRVPPDMGGVFSEEHPHHEIDLICPVAASFNCEGSQSTKFCREQEIGARTINEINKFGPVSGQIAGKIAYQGSTQRAQRDEGEAAHLARRNAILASSSSEF